MLTIYRELSDPSPELVRYLDSRGELFEYEGARGDQPVLLVSNETPRESSITPLIIACTRMFWVLDDDGRLAGKFRDLMRAEKAVESARVVFSVEYDVDDADADEAASS